MTEDNGEHPTARGFLWSVVVAQFLVQIGAFSLPALLPSYIAQWALSKTQAGWLVGIFFAAYVVAVPALVALTDRVPTRSIYVVGAGLTAISHLGFAFFADGFWSALMLRAVAGVGWAGAYMPGLKAIADVLSGNQQSRAVSAHAAGVGIAGASSFGVAGLIGGLYGPRAAFVFGGVAALIALCIAWAVMPNRSASQSATSDPRTLLDFRPVFRNRPAMAWIAGYTFHTWEMAGLRAWGVTFLTVTAVQAGMPSWVPEPTALFTIAGFIGIAVSIFGNEMSQRFGRVRIVTIAMSAAAILALCTGWTVGLSVPLAAFLVTFWLALIFFDSSALTTGTVQAANPRLRGATMGLHSMCGYAGGFLGPLGIGLALDLAKENPTLGWGLGFGQLAMIGLVGLFLVRRMT
ncbi:MFS transporter [Bradyrhizobium sp. CB1650]|uniref:MFS transporter n=1 Tax=Bradyrhizobium sp. CB1650 TaxID=3039153 RepID=UPI002435C246|nr:MFS transporter [Bradyrhizobium sp. CB1650]WGD54107.1 MFS transporter [Bradyrhizobium sp. CB1650]